MYTLERVLSLPHRLLSSVMFPLVLSLLETLAGFCEPMWIGERVARANLANVVNLVAPAGILILDDIGPESYRLLDVWRDFQAIHQDQIAWYEKQWRKGVAWAIRL